MDVKNEAVRLLEMLAVSDQRIVFAESCTGGLVAATLAQVPGVSENLCGSAVTYREATKQEWLGVSADVLTKFTAVSAPVAKQMVLGVLERTPEANIAASITGHLGPDAPTETDGVVYIGLARRGTEQPTLIAVTRHELTRGQRVDRQQEAVELVIQSVIEEVSDRS